jgi:regulator of sigma E protease
VGQEIVRVGGTDTPTWAAAGEQFLIHLIRHEPVALTVQEKDGRIHDLQLDFGTVTLDDAGKKNFFKLLGIARIQPEVPPFIGSLTKGDPAERAGFQVGDKVLTADGVPIRHWGAWVDYIAERPGKPIVATVARAGKELSIKVTPKILPAEVAGEKPSGRIGATNQAPTGALVLPPTAVMRFGPVAAFTHALAKTWDVTAMTGSVLSKMLMGQVSVQNLSGPLSIAQYAGQYADVGLAAFLEFLAVISISLFLLNLMPVPVLDGGHLLYYLLEAIIRRPLSERAQVWGQQIGVALLLGLMGIALYNDVVRLLK